MSFGIRATYKPRMNPRNQGSGITQDFHDHEVTQEIMAAIQKFKAKSSHESLLSPGERQNILRKSSVNPEINPSSQKAVEQMFRNDEPSRDSSSLSTSEMIGTHDGIGTVGFSTLSTTGYHQGTQKAKLEKELAKELEEIKERHRKKRMPAPEEDENEDETESVDESDIKYDSSGMAIIEPDGELPTNASTNYSRRPVSTLRPIFEDFQQTPIAPVSKPKRKKQSTKELDKASTDATGKRMIMMGYPARAAMARGTVPRQGGSSGMSVKRTAIGMVDAF
jgi:hypothetical protein